MEFPLVSVIIPAYNAQRFIDKTLESVLSQTYRNIEVLVIDDGSKDRTAKIVEDFARKDQRIVLFRQQNAGVAAARNLGIKKSRGEYIAPIDADDIWYPQKLEKQVQCILKEDRSVGLVYAWSLWIDEDGYISGTYSIHDFLNVHSIEGQVFSAMLYRNFIGNASAPLIRRACFDKVGGYNCKLKENNAQGCEDWDIYLRIAEFYQFRVVPKFLIGYRQLTGSMSNNTNSMAKSYELVMTGFQQRHPDIHITIFKWSKSYFYNYLLGKSFSYGDYWNTLIYIYKAIKWDLMLLLRPGLYRIIIACLIQLIAKPIISLIWQDHNSWLHFKKRIKVPHNGTTISVINSQINLSKCLWKPYDKILLKRWSKVVNNSRLISAKVIDKKNIDGFLSSSFPEG